MLSSFRYIIASGISARLSSGDTDFFLSAAAPHTALSTGRKAVVVDDGYDEQYQDDDGGGDQ